MEPSLIIDQLTAGYEGKAAVQNISLNIYKHKITAIIGPSGCGKSTLLKSLNRMLEEETNTFISGNILLEDQNVMMMDKEILRRKIGLVFQTPSPFPFSIYKNMTYAPKYYGVKRKADLDDIVKEKLKMTGLYDEVKEELQKNARHLSGGQQQRLCIARALTSNPRILLLDEPCSSLDVNSSRHIEELLMKLKRDYTIVIVTHNIAQARRISELTAFMDHGEIVEYGDTKTLFENPLKQETVDFLNGEY